MTKQDMTWTMTRAKALDATEPAAYANTDRPNPQG